MKIILLNFALIALLSACARPGVENLSRNGYGTQPLDSPNLKQRDLCIESWGRIYSEWIKNGGGIKKSILATRAQIASDSKSTLAKIIRDVWDSPKDPRIARSQLWAWPVSNQKYMELANLFEQKSKGYASDKCVGIVYLAPIMGDNLSIVSRDSLSPIMPSEAPTDINWDSNNASVWIMYWLLVRLPKK